MKTIEELQLDYYNENRLLTEAKDRYKINTDLIKSKVMLYAKYKPGEKISFKEESHKGEKIHTGIIRHVFPMAKYSNTLGVYYSIGKITKSGEIHKSHDIVYHRVAEKDIINNE